MSNYRVWLTGFALAQLEGSRTRVIREVIAIMRLLESNPRLFETDRHHQRYRRFHVDRSRVYYRIDDDNRVVRIVWIQAVSANPPLESDLEASERT